LLAFLFFFVWFARNVTAFMKILYHGKAWVSSTEEEGSYGNQFLKSSLLGHPLLPGGECGFLPLSKD